MTAETTAQGMIDTAKAYAENTKSEVVTHLNAALLAAQGWAVTNVPYPYLHEFDFLADLALDTTPGDYVSKYAAPTSKPIYNDVKSSLKDPAIDEKYTLALPDAPDPAPTGLFRAVKPSGAFPMFTESFPVLETNFRVEAAPTLNAVPAPTVHPITVPTPPEITIPRFNGVLQLDAVQAPPDVARTFTDAYERMLPQLRQWIDGQVSEWKRCHAPRLCELADQVAARLQDSLTRGSPLTPAYEQQIYDRGRARAEAERNRQVVEIQRSAAKRGFSRPCGSVWGALSQATQVASTQIVQHAAEVAVKRAEQEYTFAMQILQIAEQSVNAARGAAIQYAQMLLTINQQALEQAKISADYALELYRLVFERQRLLIDVFKAQASVWEMEVKNALVDLEIYKTRLEGLRLAQEVDKLEIDKYTALVNAQKVTVELYSEKVAAVRVRADLEKLKADLYQAKVQAYLGQVQVREAEWRGYEAAMRGDAAQLDGYAKEIDAYKAQIDARRSELDAKVEVADFKLKQNAFHLEAFKVHLAAFSAEVQAAAVQEEAASKAYAAKLDGYRARIAGQLTGWKAKMEKLMKQLDRDVTRWEIEFKAQLENAKLIQDKIKLQADTSINAAQIAAGIAGAAMGAQNSIVSLINSTEQSTS